MSFFFGSNPENGDESTIVYPPVRVGTVPPPMLAFNKEPWRYSTPSKKAPLWMDSIYVGGCHVTVTFDVYGWKDGHPPYMSFFVQRYRLDHRAGPVLFKATAKLNLTTNTIEERVDTGSYDVLHHEDRATLACVTRRVFYWAENSAPEYAHYRVALEQAPLVLRVVTARD